MVRVMGADIVDQGGWRENLAVSQEKVVRVELLLELKGGGRPCRKLDNLEALSLGLPTPLQNNGVADGARL